MKPADDRLVRCAIYARVSTDSGLGQEFNSLDAQDNASQADIRSRDRRGAGIHEVQAARRQARQGMRPALRRVSSRTKSAPQTVARFA
jgi:hypothetical protein